MATKTKPKKDLALGEANFAAERQEYQGLGANYSEAYDALLSDAASTGEPLAKFVKERRDQLQNKLHRFSSGEVNKRRGVIREEARKLYHQTLADIHNYRQQLAAASREEAKEQAKKAGKTLNPTEALLNFQRLQTRLQASSDDALQSKIGFIESSKSKAARALSISSRDEYELTLAELQRRGLSEDAERLSKAFEDIPVDGIGNRDVAKALENVELYEAKTDVDEVVVRDASGRKVGLQVDTVLQWDGGADIPA